MTEETPTKPYVNDYQKWVAESKTAGVCLVLWEIGGASVVVAGLLRTELLLIGGGAMWLLVSLLIHFWRDEVAPDMRHTRGELSENEA